MVTDGKWVNVSFYGYLPEGDQISQDPLQTGIKLAGAFGFSHVADVSVTYGVSSPAPGTEGSHHG